MSMSRTFKICLSFSGTMFEIESYLFESFYITQSRCLDTVFSGPSQAFSISSLTVLALALVGSDPGKKITPVIGNELKFGLMYFLKQSPIFSWTR